MDKLDGFSISLELESCSKKIKQRFLNEDFCSQQEYDDVLAVISDLKTLINRIDKRKGSSEF